MGACARNIQSDSAEIKPAQCCIKLVFHLTYSWYSFLFEAKSTPGPQWNRKEMPMTNSIVAIGNRSRDLPACNAILQPTTPRHAPVSICIEPELSLCEASAVSWRQDLGYWKASRHDTLSVCYFQIHMYVCMYTVISSTEIYIHPIEGIIFNLIYVAKECAYIVCFLLGISPASEV